MAWNSSSISSCLFINNDNLYRNNIRMVLSRKIHQSDAFIFQSQFILLYSWYWNSFIRHHSPSENNSEKSENWRNDLKKSSNTRPIKKIRWRCGSQKILLKGKLSLFVDNNWVFIYSVANIMVMLFAIKEIVTNCTVLLPVSCQTGSAFD